MENILSLLVVGLVGAVVGFFISNWYQKNRHSDGSVKAVEEKLQHYQNDVEQHFAKTAELIDNLTDSYKDVFNHLSESAEQLLTDEQIKNQLANRKSREVTIKYLKGDSIEPESEAGDIEK